MKREDILKQIHDENVELYIFGMLKGTSGMSAPNCAIGCPSG